MNVTTFLFLLFVFSAVTGLFTELAKKFYTEKTKLPYNILVLAIALIVGGCGTAIYYQLNGMEFTLNNMIYMFLLSLSSGLSAMLGYDKIKQTILQIANKES